jgi:hypothetical protein
MPDSFPDFQYGGDDRFGVETLPDGKADPAASENHQGDDAEQIQDEV